MTRLLLIVFTIGGFIFSGSLDEGNNIDIMSNIEKNEYSWSIGSDDYNVEAGRRRGKHNRGDRRRGGGGLR